MGMEKLDTKVSEIKSSNNISKYIINPEYNLELAKQISPIIDNHKLYPAFKMKRDFCKPINAGLSYDLEKAGYSSELIGGFFIVDNLNLTDKADLEVLGQLNNYKIENEVKKISISDFVKEHNYFGKDTRWFTWIPHWWLELDGLIIDRAFPMFKSALEKSITKNNYSKKDFNESFNLQEVYPNKNESKKDFIARFMSITKNEYPDINQRFAVANSYWNKGLKESLENDLFLKAKRTFNTTLNYKLAGYLLPDGSALNFSDGQGRRVLDHRDISEIYDDLTEMTGTDCLLNFVNLGAIRLIPEIPGIHLIQEPTDEQYVKIASFYNALTDDYFDIEIWDANGNVKAGWEYYNRVSPRAVILDIKEFFKSGKIPRVNENYDNNKNSLQNDNQASNVKFGLQDDIFYHGSPVRDIKQFKINDNGIPQTFFTKSKALAKEYTYDLDTGAHTGCLYTVKLDLKNPLDVESALGKALKAHLGVSENNVRATDEIFKYLTKRNGKIKLINKDGSKKELIFDGIVSREDLPAKLKQKLGPAANICYVPLRSDQISIIGTELFTEDLHEDTRSQLLNVSRNAGPYLDSSKGKNRFERKKFSKVANQVKSFNQIDMNKFFKEDVLEVVVPVVGETASYNVTLRFEKTVEEIKKNILANKNVLEYRTIVQALTKVFNSADVYIKCDCPDFEYRFEHYSITDKYGFDDSSKDPGPGKGIANPLNDKGKGCKHVLLVLNNLTWLMKVASVINNYINYAAQNMKKAFLQVIFPKLYGVPATAAEEEQLVPEDTNLETTKDIINLINDFGKNRGKYQKGSNRNPVNDKRNN